MAPTHGHTRAVSEPDRAAAGHAGHAGAANAAVGPQHGHGIGVAISSLSQDALQIDHGSLYPALHRLERQGWIEAEWKLSENKQRAKYYRLTRTGKKQLLVAESKWNRLIEAIARVMQPAKS